MRAMGRLRAGYEFRVRAEYKQFVGVDEDVELRAEFDLMHALQLRNEVDVAGFRAQVQIRFRAAQFGEFEPARHGDRLCVARRETQMPWPDADAARAAACLSGGELQRHIDAD